MHKWELDPDQTVFLCTPVCFVYKSQTQFFYCSFDPSAASFSTSPGEVCSSCRGAQLFIWESFEHWCWEGRAAVLHLPDSLFAIVFPDESEAIAGTAILKMKKKDQKVKDWKRCVRTQGWRLFKMKLYVWDFVHVLEQIYIKFWFQKDFPFLFATGMMEWVQEQCAQLHLVGFSSQLVPFWGISGRGSYWTPSNDKETSPATERAFLKFSGYGLHRMSLLAIRLQLLGYQ